MPQTIETKIAGVFSYPEAKEPLKNTPVGGRIIFEREPHNTHDANAIALYIEGPSINSDFGIATADIRKFKIGYVPRDKAAILRDRKIISMRRGEKWDSVLIDIE